MSKKMIEQFNISLFF